MIDLNKIKSIALVGASDNPEKFGNKILHNLLKRDFQVFPVNNKKAEIAGIKAYASLRDLPCKPDMVNIVVPPKIASQVVEQALSIGIENVWIQPGAESDELIAKLKQSGVNYVVNACVMV